jgi:hypothetical protein
MFMNRRKISNDTFSQCILEFLAKSAHLILDPFPGPASLNSLRFLNEILGGCGLGHQ